MQVANLTERQQQLVDLLMEMKTRDQIKKEMGIGESAMKQNVRRIARNMGIEKGRYLLTVRIMFCEAQRRGLVPAVW